MRFKKDPDSTLDFHLNWSLWLGDDTITASEWLVPPALSVLSESFTDTTTTVWLEGGVVGAVYTVTNRITTAGGRIDDRSIFLSIKQK